MYLKSYHVHALKLLPFASDSSVEIRAMDSSVYFPYCVACDTEATRRLFQVGAMEWLAVAFPVNIPRQCSH